MRSTKCKFTGSDSRSDDGHSRARLHAQAESPGSGEREAKAAQAVRAQVRRSVSLFAAVFRGVVLMVVQSDRTEPTPRSVTCGSCCAESSNELRTSNPQNTGAVDCGRRI